MFAMCAENVTEARRDRLLVADVGKQRFEDGQLRTWRRWDVQPRLRHRDQEAGGLQRHRFSTGVRSRDDQHTGRRAHVNVHRDRLFDVAADFRHQQRMTRGHQIERAVCGNHRFHSADHDREPRPRLDDVELGRDLDRPLELFRPAAERVGQLEQDAAHFLGFLLLERHDVVIDLNGLEWLDEQAGAAG